jgi:hypothetical protein
VDGEVLRGPRELRWWGYDGGSCDGGLGAGGVEEDGRGRRNGGEFAVAGGFG